MTTQTNINQKQSYNFSGRPPVSSTATAIRFFSVLVTVLFWVSGAYLGYLFYGTVKETVVSAEVPALPYIDLTLPSVGGQGPTVGVVPQRGGEIPITGITGVPLPDYEQKERVNILLLGIDKRPNEVYARTDTMILVTIDPENKIAGMVSIPRDLWVDIPGYYEARINTAHYLGDKNGHPGGGPALAMQTVQQHFGVPVHFYIKVDFDGFRKVVDTIGGIDVNVPYAINDPEYPDHNYGYDPFYINAGQHHLDGATALKYARTRHSSGGDFGRAARQQQVLLAIKDKALQLGMLPKIPELWSTMAGTGETDLQLVDIAELANLADEINSDDVSMIVLGEDYTINHVTDQGAMVLLPLWDKIYTVVDTMFSEVQPQGPSQAEVIAAQASAAAQEAELHAQEQQRNEIKTQLATEGAKVVIQNGTTNEGVDAEIALFLKEQGFNVVQFGPADTKNYPRTVIVDYSGKEYSLGTLVNFFSVTPENVRRSPNLNSDVDIRVIIGNDFEIPEAAQKSSFQLK